MKSPYDTEGVGATEHHINRYINMISRGIPAWFVVMIPDCLDINHSGLRTTTPNSHLIDGRLYYFFNNARTLSTLYIKVTKMQ